MRPSYLALWPAVFQKWCVCVCGCVIVCVCVYVVNTSDLPLETSSNYAFSSADVYVEVYVCGREPHGCLHALAGVCVSACMYCECVSVCVSLFKCVCVCV